MGAARAFSSDWLVGRAAEATQIARFVAELAAGRGGVALLRGEPGIGKSALLSVSAERTAELGLQVYFGAAERLESRLPFSAIGNCLGISASSPDLRLSEIARMLRGQAADGYVFTSRLDVQAAATEALMELVDDLCAISPVLIVLDDLQWADPASILVVHLLGRATAQMPLLLAISCRTSDVDDDVETLLQGLSQRPGAVTLHLRRLSDEDSVALAEQVLGATVGAELQRIVSGAAGNPLYVRELVAALKQRDHLKVSAGVVDLPAGNHTDLSRSLAGTIHIRLAFLSRRARDILQIAALLGTSFSLMELSIVLGTSISAILGPIAEATQANVLQDSGRMLSFQHDLIREALAEAIPEAMRNAIHLQAGRALEEAGASVERIGDHLLRAGALDGWARSWLAGTADQLMTCASDLAVDLLSEAVRDASSGDGLRGKLAAALFWCGRFEEAERAARAALVTNADPQLNDRLLNILLYAPFWRGRPDIMLSEAQKALKSQDLTKAEKRHVECALAQSLVATRQVEIGTKLAEQVFAEALTEADDEVAAQIAMTLAAGNLLGCHFDDALSIADKGLSIAARGAFDPAISLGLYVNRAAALAQLDQVGQAEVALESGSLTAEKTGGSSRAWYYAQRAAHAFRTGRWDDALAEVKTGLSTVEYSDAQFRLAEDGRGLAALIAVRRGDTQRARYQLVLASGVPASGVRLYEYWMVWARAMLAEADGHPREALDELRQFWLRGTDTLAHEMLHFLCPDLARLAASLGESTVLESVATDLRQQTAISTIHSVRAASAFVDGLASDDPALLQAAADGYHRADWQIHRAQASEQLAVSLARAGQFDEARTAADCALDIYAGLNAGWDIARANAALRQHGVLRGVRGRRQRPKTGWEALTDTEHRVAAMVAEGQSNPVIAGRLYLSRRTVQTHVSSIFAKLGLTSRVELAAEVTRVELSMSRE